MVAKRSNPVLAKCTCYERVFQNDNPTRQRAINGEKTCPSLTHRVEKTSLGILSRDHITRFKLIPWHGNGCLKLIPQASNSCKQRILYGIELDGAAV